MDTISKIALVKALLMGILPEETQRELFKKPDEDEALRAMSEGRIDKCEVQKRIDKEFVKPLYKIEAKKRKPFYYTDERGNIRRKTKEELE